MFEYTLEIAYDDVVWKAMLALVAVLAFVVYALRKKVVCAYVFVRDTWWCADFWYSPLFNTYTCIEGVGYDSLTPINSPEFVGGRLHRVHPTEITATGCKILGKKFNFTPEKPQ